MLGLDLYYRMAQIFQEFKDGYDWCWVMLELDLYHRIAPNILGVQSSRMLLKKKGSASSGGPSLHEDGSTLRVRVIKQCLLTELSEH